MPLYEYACQKCEHTFEALIFAGDKPACPQCESENLERLLSVPGRPKVNSGSLPMSAGSCGDLSLPPCGAAGCRRTGKA